MKAVPFVSCVLVLTAALAGCCTMGQTVCPNDPCARELAGGGCPLKRLLDHTCSKCQPKAPCTCGGVACGTVVTGACSPVGCAVPTACGSPVDPGCGCGSAAIPPTPPQYPPPAPAPQAPPQPLPVDVAPQTPVGPGPAPGPPAEGASAAAPSVQTAPVATAEAPLSTQPPQHVTYEEFQKLPGVIISGPTPVPAPSRPAVAQATRKPAPRVPPVMPESAVVTPANGWQATGSK